MADRSADARVYAGWKRRLFVVDLLLTAGFFAVILCSGFSARLSEEIAARIPGAWPFQVAAYVGFLWIASTLILFPLSWFGSFKLEHRFGLSTQRFSQWLLDYGKRFALSGGMGLLLVEVLGFLLRRTPESWWLWAAVLWMGWEVLMARVLPTLLIPIFYKQSPLANESLRQRLFSFVTRCGAQVEGIYEINLSKTTTKANACLCGLGRTRRILVSDTLIAAYPPEEVEVVLAHEVGHHALHHIGILLVVSTIAAGISFWGVDRWARLAFAQLGIAGLADLAALPVLGLGLFVANLILMPVINGISRYLENQADEFALNKTRSPGAFIQTMRRLAEQNLAELQPPAWVEWLLYDHPPIAKRIALGERWKDNG